MNKLKSDYKTWFSCFIWCFSIVVFSFIVTKENHGQSTSSNVFYPSKPYSMQIVDLTGFKNKHEILMIGIGDSLSHGTMDGTNNFISTKNAYLHKIFMSLNQETAVSFTQPFFDFKQNRINPFILPTNLATDGADIFSVAGIEYFKRVGSEQNKIVKKYLCDKVLPKFFRDKYDKVLYPINILSHSNVSQIDSALWLLDKVDKQEALFDKVIITVWIGSNDSSLAVLGFGGVNPVFQSIPLDLIEPEISPKLSKALNILKQTGTISDEPYTLDAIKRNLTDVDDFSDQYRLLLNRITDKSNISSIDVELFLLTLPDFSIGGYLFDSEDMEFYLQKLNPFYTVPDTFKRVTAVNQPITNPLQGDRISLLTFGVMYALLDSGYSVEYVNQAIETNGEQRDGLVISESEQQVIRSKIDEFNNIISDLANTGNPNIHLVNIGKFLDETFVGESKTVINHRTLSRKWIRGNGFSFDGVHPGYTNQALIANFVLNQIKDTININAPLYDLSLIMEKDPYIDKDKDGWAAGPNYPGFWETQLLFLFKDPNDSDANIQPELPDNFWELFSSILLGGMSSDVNSTSTN